MEKGEVYIVVGDDGSPEGRYVPIYDISNSLPKGQLQPGDIFMVMEKWQSGDPQIFHFPTCATGFVMYEGLNWWEIREIEL